VDAHHLVEFAHRDRRTLARLKASYWAARKRRLGAGEGLRVAEELRRYVRTLRPDWPSAEDRETDLATHARVAEMLRSVRAR
jgi:hypothetical protein